jgi:hypothetical protein
MVCTCKNEEGKLAASCLGICSNQGYNIYDIAKIESILNSFLIKVDQRIQELGRMIYDSRQIGFKEGFEIAREIYE